MGWKWPQSRLCETAVQKQANDQSPFSPEDSNGGFTSPDVTPPHGIHHVHVLERVKLAALLLVSASLAVGRPSVFRRDITNRLLRVTTSCSTLAFDLGRCTRSIILVAVRVYDHPSEVV